MKDTTQITGQRLKQEESTEYITKVITNKDLNKSETMHKSVGYAKREQDLMIHGQQIITFQESQTHLCFLPIDHVTQEEKTHHHLT